MRLGEGVEWAVHSCVLLAFLPPGETLTSARLAEFHALAPAYLAKHLQALAHGGVVASVPGARGGYRLARPADQTTLLEIVTAIEGDEAAFRCTEIRERGPAGSVGTIPCGIARAMWRAEEAWRSSLSATTVADVVAGLATDVDPDAAARAAAWLSEVTR